MYRRTVLPPDCDVWHVVFPPLTGFSVLPPESVKDESDVHTRSSHCESTSKLEKQVLGQDTNPLDQRHLVLCVYTGSE